MPRKSKGPYLKWRKDRAQWYIFHYTGKRPVKKPTGFASRGEAEQALAEYILTQRRHVGPSNPHERLIDDVLADYVEERGRHLKSPKTLTTCVRELSPFWGDKTVSTIREETCRLYWKHRNEQYQKRQRAKRGKKAEIGDVRPSVVARELSVLSAAVNHDYKAGRLTLPVPVWKPSFDNRKDRFLTRAEAARLIRQARGLPSARKYLPLFILIGLYTGARHSAILSLRWPQVNFNTGLIDFNPPGRERTSKGRPIIPIPRRLMTFLRLAKRRGTDLGYVLHRNQKRIASVKKTFGECVRRAGLAGVSPHTLRHTAASWMAQKGVPFPKIARYLGHRNSRTTEEIYAHHAPDYLRDAADSYDNRPDNRPKKTEHSKESKTKKKNPQ